MTTLQKLRNLRVEVEMRCLRTLEKRGKFSSMDEVKHAADCIEFKELEKASKLEGLSEYETAKRMQNFFNQGDSLCAALKKL